jgi:hypothetical protein
MLIYKELGCKPIEKRSITGSRSRSGLLRNRFFAGLVLCCIVLANPELLPAQEYPTPPPVEVFSEQILQSIAVQVANEHITQLKYQLAYQYAKDERLALQKINEDQELQSRKTSDDPIAGAEVMRSAPGKDMKDSERRVREAQHNEFLAWLDTRRVALKEELLSLWQRNVLIKGHSYYVCIESIWREYSFINGRFHRLDNAVGSVGYKAGTCEGLDLKTMKSLTWKEELIR